MLCVYLQTLEAALFMEEEESVAVCKVYNIKRHSQMKHFSTHDELNG